MATRTQTLPRLVQNERILAEPPPHPGATVRFERPEGATDPNHFEVCRIGDKSLIARIPALTASWFEMTADDGLVWQITAWGPGVLLERPNTTATPSGSMPLKN
jgi:hypothetical protein